LHTPKQGLLKGFCDVSKIGDNPENNLAKFGYTPVLLQIHTLNCRINVAFFETYAKKKFIIIFLD